MPIPAAESSSPKSSKGPAARTPRKEQPLRVVFFRMLPQVFRSSLLYDMSLTEDHPLIRELPCDFDLMRDAEERALDLLFHQQKLSDHFLPGEYIERTGGLIRQDQLRLRQERTHDAHALHHTAGELRGIAVPDPAGFLQSQLLHKRKGFFTK